MTIGERIAVRRKELGMTQTDLAIKMGYKSKAAISKIETNVNDITQSIIVRFADALDTSVKYLMGWDEEEQHKYGGELPGDFANVIDLDMVLTKTEAKLIESWRQATDEERENVAFILRNYGMPKPTAKKQSEDPSWTSAGEV